MRSVLACLRQLSAALRILLIFTVVFGVAYPLAITAVAQIPGLRSRAGGSLIKVNGQVIGSKLIGQIFTDSKGNPLAQYFQSRPSAAGAGYDPTSSGASNLGPESIVDTLPNPSVKGDAGKQSLLTQVCSRSLAVGMAYGVDGSRPFCTPDGVGAVLAVLWSGPGFHGHVVRAVSMNQACPATPFLANYHGVTVECARFGDDYSHGQVVPIRGSASAKPAVPAAAVTSSASGLDPEISPAYAKLQEASVAKARGISVAQIDALVRDFEKGRDLGFMGEARVNVLQLNVALDKDYPFHGK
ncbi:MAG: potassium-transporting ATPase subunit C [Actinomycetota bacterium]|nr:potassium-transporting ATPase subunit C [Actinomycetota bacterium]